MSEANVSSVDAIDLFRAALLVYLSKAKPVLEDACDEVSRAKFRQPYAAVFFYNQPRRTPDSICVASADVGAQVPVNGRLPELQPGDRTDVETAKLGPPLPHRHVNAGDFVQVLVGLLIGGRSGLQGQD